jgi:hypothetical protein
VTIKPERATGAYVFQKKRDANPLDTTLGRAKSVPELMHECR